jgi:hypothetical protein
MSRDVVLFYGYWDVILEKYVQAGVENMPMVVRALELCGTHKDNIYFILSVDQWEDDCPSSKLSMLFDKYFPDAVELYSILYKCTKRFDQDEWYVIEEQFCKEFDIEVKGDDY